MKRYIYLVLMLIVQLFIVESFSAQTPHEQKSEAQKSYDKGWLLFNQDKYEESFIYLNKAATLDAQNYLYAYAKGRVLARLNKYNDAITSYTASIKMNPKYADAYGRRAGCIILRGISSQKELEMVKTDCDKAILLENSNFAANYNRGMYYLHVSDHMNAEKDFSKCIEIDPGNYLSYVYRAKARAGMNKHYLAMEDCNRAIVMKPDWSDAYFQRALIYSSQNKHSLAISDCNKSIDNGYSMQESYYPSYLLRAYSLYQINQFEEAVNDCNVVLGALPSNKDALQIKTAAQNEIEKSKKNKQIEMQRLMEGLSPKEKLLVGIVGLVATGLNTESKNDQNISSSYKGACRCGDCNGRGKIEQLTNVDYWDTRCGCYLTYKNPPTHCHRCMGTGKIDCNK